MKRLICLLLLLFLLCPAAMAAQSTTYTYGLNRKGDLVRTQDAYLPDRTITHLGLSAPEDIFFGPEDLLYIADTGNSRVLIYDIHRDIIVSELVHEDFRAPRGLFVTAEGVLYVADSAASAVFCFDAQGQLEFQVGMPAAAVFEGKRFAPYRVAAGPSGSLYLVCEGDYDGILQLSGSGEFLGYFTSNQTTLTLVQRMQNLFLTKTQLEGLTDRIPLTFSGVYIDDRGLVYTASMGRSGMGVKKHDMAGRNMLQDAPSAADITDITVDGYGTIYASAKSGLICVYASDGELIFGFGTMSAGNADIAGLYSSLIALAVSSEGHIWTLDGDKTYLQSYTPTDYTRSIFRAIELFNAGLYDQSGAQWEDVLRYNQMSVLAHQGLGKSHLYRQRYEQAQLHFNIAGNRALYSQAFWETRNDWLMANLTYFLIAAAVLLVLSVGLRAIDRKRRVAAAVHGAISAVTGHRRLRSVAFAGTVARHPLDAYYLMRRREGGTLPGASIWFGVLFVSFMVYQTARSFMIRTQDVEDMDFAVIIGGFFALFVIFVVCNYLVTSINDGEGSLSDIFKVVGYASMPLSAALLAATAMTHVITLNEVFLLQLTLMAGGVWSGILFYLGLQEIHSYSFGTTAKSLLITAAFMVIILIVLFNMSILFDQFTLFIEAVVREGVGNVLGLY